MDRADAGWALLLCLLSALIVTRVDQIEELSLGPLRARLRERLSRADALVAMLQDMALLNGRILLSVVKRSGRFGGYSDEESEHIRNDLVKLLKRIEISDDDVAGLSDEWNKFIAYDYAILILGGSQIPKGLAYELIEEWKVLRNGGIERMASPDEIRRFLHKAGLLNDVRREFIADLEYFLKSKTHRRPWAWERRVELFKE